MFCFDEKSISTQGALSKRDKVSTFMKNSILCTFFPRDYYLNRLPDDSSVKAYQTFLKDSAQLFGAASTEAHKFSVDMFNFEKRLAEITPDFEYLADPIKTLNRMTMKDLHTMSMNIPWLDIAKAAYSEAPLVREKCF